MSDAQFQSIIAATQDYSSLSITDALAILSNNGDQYDRHLLAAELNAAWNGNESNAGPGGALGSGTFNNPLFPNSSLNGLTINQLNHLAFTTMPPGANASLNDYMNYLYICIYIYYLGDAGEGACASACLVTPVCATPVPTNTPTNTLVPTNTPTNTPVPTNTPTNTTVPTNTPTNTPVPTNTPTNTPVPTNTPTNTPVPTNTPTNTPVPTNTPTNTPVPTNTPTNTPTGTPTPTPTAKVPCVDGLVHQSLENFFDSGGTQVLYCVGLGCTADSFSFGDVSGTVLWEVTERVFKECSAQTTTFAYTVYNDVLTPDVASFHVADHGFLGTATAPASWTFAEDMTTWSWMAFDSTGDGIPDNTIPPFGSRFMSVELWFSTTNVTVTFDTAYIDMADGSVLQSPDWKASSPIDP